MIINKTIVFNMAQLSPSEVLTKLFILERGEIKAGRLTEPSLGSHSVTGGRSLTPGAFVPAIAASEERN